MAKIYPNLLFPKLPNRPYYYSNFVQTIDGIVDVKNSKNAYWPIGSKTDYNTLLELRACADVLIHGKNTAMHTRTIDNLGLLEFQNRRKTLKKDKPIIYAILSAHPDQDLIDQLSNPPPGTKPLLVTTEEIDLDNIPGVRILKFGLKKVDLLAFSKYLFKNGVNTALIEGGPTTMGKFMADNLIDELFVTIAPKIIGNLNGRGLTMVEDQLFDPKSILNLKLLSSINIGDELYLRYKVKN